MGGRVSIDGGRLARGSSNQSGCRQRCLQDNHDRPVLSADSGIHVGRNSPHEARDQVRALSVLAGLLTPFADERAQRTAKELLDRFGTLERILSASDDLLLKALPSDVRTIQLISAARALVLAGLQESVARTPLDTSSASFQTYIVAKFKGKVTEELHAIFVDCEMGYLAEDLVSIGSSDQVDARVTCILRRGLELSAAGFVLVHNHPSRSPKPSATDVRATKQTKLLSRSVGIALIDHLIVAGNRVTSMKELQLI
jgi:DNA repair protein RadC